MTPTGQLGEIPVNFRISGFNRVWGVMDLRFIVQGFGFRVQGLGFGAAVREWLLRDFLEHCSSRCL